MEVFQLKSEKGNTYIVFRFFDDKNKNYEYKTYKLVKSINVAREFGILDKIPNRKTKLNTREMCDRLIEKINTNKK
ncbi:MAG: hypothetical protein KYX68_03390 [Flavobacterium sp.]|nr:hypothetical protein [Flavobacterium sp.]